MKTSPPRIPSALFLLVALAFHAPASVSDFTRTATPNWNGREGPNGDRPGTAPARLIF